MTSRATLFGAVFCVAYRVDLFSQMVDGDNQLIVRGQDSATNGGLVKQGIEMIRAQSTQHSTYHDS